jgi:hypothetical protein
MVVLASSTSGDLQLLRRADQHFMRIGDERERLVTASPVMTKSWLGETIPGERPRETAET